jgi:esterase
VLGHSMGGKSVMTLALAHPERVASLAVADIAPVAYNHRFGVELEAMQALDLTQVRRRSDAATQMSAYISDPALAAFLLQNLNVGANGASWRINLPAITQSEASLVGFPEQTSAYGGVTSFICGAQSDYVQTAHRGIIEPLFPAATIATIDDAGHWLHAERPKDFIAEFRAHLARASH